MKRVLFVDDEPNILAGLRRMLYPLRGEWSMDFAGSGREALAKLSESPFDVLITDVRMPGMNGTELLAAVMEQYPQVVRMVLSGTTEREFTLQSVTLAHQCLSKPCDAGTLRATVDRAFALRHLLEHPGLKELVSRTPALPSIPYVYRRLTEALHSGEATTQQVADILTQDVAMAAKILQVANSALFGLQRRITSLPEAVMTLGTETVRDLTLGLSAFAQFRVSGEAQRLVENLRDHSLTVARLAHQITRSFQLARPAAMDAFVAGLLHDVGKLVLIAHHADQYGKVLKMAQERSIAVRAVEQEFFGATHTEVGTYLAWLWGLPEAVTQVTAFHHDPGGSEPGTARLVTAVHVADALANGRGDTGLDLEYLMRMGWADSLEEWKAL